jgi:Sigma-70, region 4/SnoaL-like domain
MAAAPGEPFWLEPYPDDELPDAPSGPAARYPARESVSLAFVASLQGLPPLQRAALVLRDVLGFDAAQAAEILQCEVGEVDSSLEHARAALPPPGRDQAPPPGSPAECDVVARFSDAFERGDVGGVAALMTDDVWLWTPPLPFRYRGRQAAGHFLAAFAFRGGSRRFRLVPTRANGQPAFGCYLFDERAWIAHGHGLIVLTLTGDRISAITRFLDKGVLARFGLPRTLPE